MKKDSNVSENYVERIPVTNKNWELLEDGIVEITVENTGFYNTLAQKLFKKPRFSFIKLDKFGSFVWQNIDGKTSIYEIGQKLKVKFPKESDKLYERLCAFIKILERNNYVKF